MRLAFNRHQRRDLRTFTRGQMPKENSNLAPPAVPRTFGADSSLDSLGKRLNSFLTKTV
jgi:hypothetical protein